MNEETVKFIEWTQSDSFDWGFNYTLKLWMNDGYRSRTTPELFTYFKEIILNKYP